jgi:hypothetical protein
MAVVGKTHSSLITLPRLGTSLTSLRPNSGNSQQINSTNSYDSAQVTDEKQDPKKKGFFEDFWDWQGALISLSALIAAGLSSTVLYKPIVRNLGIGKLINKSPIGEFYGDKRDSIIDGFKGAIPLDQLGLSKDQVKVFLNGNLTQMQEIVDRATRNLNTNTEIVSSSLQIGEWAETLIHGLEANGNTKAAQKLRERIKSHEPLLPDLLDEINDLTGLIGINFKEELLNQLPHNQETFGNFFKDLSNQAVGRILSFAGAYGLTTYAASQLMVLSNKEDKANKAKNKKDDSIMESDPLLDFFEQVFLMGMGAWFGHGAGTKLKLGKTGLRFFMGLGAIAGFGSAELMSNGIRFIYNKFREMLPEDKKDSIALKTAFDLGIGALIAWLIYTKGVLLKFGKFSGAMTNPSLRPTSNAIAGGLMMSSNQIVECASLSLPNKPIDSLGATWGIRTPEGSTHVEQAANMALNAGKSPYQTLNDSIKYNHEKLQQIKEKAPVIGRIAESLTKVFDIFAGFPLVQKMAEKHENGFVPLNAEYWARGTGDIVIKLFNKIIVCGIFAIPAYPFVYLYNLLVSKFGKDKDKEVKVQSASNISVKLAPA